MTRANVTSLVSSTIAILEDTTKDYNIVKDDKGLREAFHEAGRGLPIVGEALRTAKTRLQGHDLAGDPQSAISALEACNAKTKLSQSIFNEVAQAPETSRFERYKAAMGRQGRRNLVEVLVAGMMNDTCTLAKESAIEATMETQIKALRDAMDTLSKMEPSVQAEQSGNTFSHYGSGHQFNATKGAQNNNTGSGNQFTGATFSGPVHF